MGEHTCGFVGRWFPFNATILFFLTGSDKGSRKDSLACLRLQRVYGCRGRLPRKPQGPRRPGLGKRGQRIRKGIAIGHAPAPVAIGPTLEVFVHRLYAASPPEFSHDAHQANAAYLTIETMIGEILGLCVIYVGAGEWFEHLLWAIRLM